MMSHTPNAALPVLSILRSRATAEDGRSNTAEGGEPTPVTPVMVAVRMVAVRKDRGSAFGR